MNTNLNRLWAIVDVETADVLYSTVQYSKAQKQLAYYQRQIQDDKGNVYPACIEVYCRNLKLVRYDLARHYVEPTFGSCLKSALVGSLPKV